VGCSREVARDKDAADRKQRRIEDEQHRHARSAFSGERHVKEAVSRSSQWSQREQRNGLEEPISTGPLGQTTYRYFFMDFGC
jgi:hypothetical protein